MPWCENCEKRGLKTNEIAFDEKNHRVLCIPCAETSAVTSNDEALKGEIVDKTWFGVGYTSDHGLKAELIYGGARLTVNVSNDQISRLMGR